VNATPEPDRDRFAEWFVSSQRDIYRYILAAVPSLDEADEIFQETGLVLWKKHEELESRDHFLRFAFGVARTCIRSFLSKKKRDRHIFSDEFLVMLADFRFSDSGWHETQIAALNGCVEGLAESQRKLIQDFYSGDCATAQLADELEVSENALYQKLHRIRRELFDCVTKALKKEAS